MTDDFSSGRYNLQKSNTAMNIEQMHMHEMEDKRHRRRKLRTTASESPARDYKGSVFDKRRKPEESTSNVPNVVISRSRDDEVKAASDVERTEETSVQLSFSDDDDIDRKPSSRDQADLAREQTRDVGREGRDTRDHYQHGPLKQPSMDSSMSRSTIGFGDIVPGQALDEGSQEKLVVCALYLLFGMALIAMCFKLMQDDVVQKARWLGQKIGILGRFHKLSLPCVVFLVRNSRPMELSEMIARHAFFIFGATETVREAMSVREDLSESESEIEDDMIEEDDEDMSEERTDQAS
ncbi:unnamed protein product [Nippostrongylus brasiliensis]|uniref:Ion_trans_2 domain-containing protein n=1 Tax=Nippostrongylus brasiliensis TaxID=27835 RepID=A0A0N4Y5T7_NIPBR|nr:unnamed protein product [Nippostrongylus brasiliensis]